MYMTRMFHFFFTFLYPFPFFAITDVENEEARLLLHLLPFSFPQKYLLAFVTNCDCDDVRFCCYTQVLSQDGKCGWVWRLKRTNLITLLLLPPVLLWYWLAHFNPIHIFDEILAFLSHKNNENGIFISLSVDIDVVMGWRNRAPFKIGKQKKNKEREWKAGKQEESCGNCLRIRNEATS